MESKMARHQPQGHIAEPRQAWLVIVLFGALPGCGSDSTAKKSVDVGAENFSVPTASRAHALATAVAIGIEEISVPDPSPTEPVTAVMTIQPKRASVGETVEVLVRIRIAGAHFIHAKGDAGGPFVPVAVNTTLPEGVEPIGDWQVPTPEKGHGNSPVYRNSVLLRRSLKIVSSSAPETLTVIGELQYQVCTDELCWPQGKLKLSAPLMIQSQPR
jgi:Disulphide bond corrector protein DsbC